MSIVEQAKSELGLIGFGTDDTKVMIEILEKFFDQWDSGGAVHAVAPILQRCIAGKPLSPLTGADSEWFQPMDDVECYQNKRCGSVFKEKDNKGNWIVYDIDKDPTPGVSKVRHRWASREVTLPYWPGRAEVSSPVITIETEDKQ